MDIKETAPEFKELTVGLGGEGEMEKIRKCHHIVWFTMIKVRPDIGSFLERKVEESWWEVISH